MGTLINNPADTTTNSAVGTMVAVVIGIVLLVLFFVYALPAMRGTEANNAGAGTNVDVQIPNPTVNTTPAPQQ